MRRGTGQLKVNGCLGGCPTSPWLPSTVPSPWSQEVSASSPSHIEPWFFHLKRGIIVLTVVAQRSCDSKAVLYKMLTCDSELLLCLISLPSPLLTLLSISHSAIFVLPSSPPLPLHGLELMALLCHGRGERIVLYDPRRWCWC